MFLWLSMSRPKSSLPHVLMFMAAAISAMSFYAMWTGVGVECVPCPSPLTRARTQAHVCRCHVQIVRGRGRGEGTVGAVGRR